MRHLRYNCRQFNGGDAKQWNRVKENAAAAAALATVFVGFVALAQFGIVYPIRQRFDGIDQRFGDLRTEMNQRFDAQDKIIDQRFDAVDQRFDGVEERLGFLSGEVSDLRRLTDRVSRNESRLDAVTQQLQSIGRPAP